MQKMTVTVDGKKVEVPIGLDHPRGGERRRVAGADPVPRQQAPSFRRVPGLPRRGGRHAAQVHAVVHDAGHGQHGREDHVARAHRGAADGARTPPDQAPPGLPGLRQGGRVPAPGPGARVRARQEPVRRGKGIPPAGLRELRSSSATSAAASSAASASGSATSRTAWASGPSPAGARGPGSAPISTGRWTASSAANAPRSAPWARSPRASSSTRPGRGTSKGRHRSAITAAAAAASATKRVTARSCGSGPARNNYLCAKGRFGWDAVHSARAAYHAEDARGRRTRGLHLGRGAVRHRDQPQGDQGQDAAPGASAGSVRSGPRTRTATCSRSSSAPWSGPAMWTCWPGSRSRRG